VKTKLKKDDSMAMLRAKCARPIANAAEQDVVVAITAAKDDMTHINQSITAGEENILKRLLTTCSYDEMKIVGNNFTRSGGVSADKIITVIKEMSKRHKSLVECVEYVSDIQMKYEQLLIDLYLKEYTSYNEATGDTTFNNKAFMAMLGKALTYKEGERDALIAAGEAAAQAAALANSQQRCVIS